jgi:hypothetical protein
MNITHDFDFNPLKNVTNEWIDKTVELALEQAKINGEIKDEKTFSSEYRKKLIDQLKKLK